MHFVRALAESLDVFHIRCHGEVEGLHAFGSHDVDLAGPRVGWPRDHHDHPAVVEALDLETDPSGATEGGHHRHQEHQTTDHRGLDEVDAAFFQFMSRLRCHDGFAWLSTHEIGDAALKVKVSGTRFKDWMLVFRSSP